jgi:5,5'-dehydrodivanillate O-demethylase
MLRVGSGGLATFQIRVPIDDTHTWHVWYQTYAPGGPVPPQESIPVYPVPLTDADGEWLRDYVDGQDIVAWVTQGDIADRTEEHLGTSDLGVITLRRLLLEQIDRVEDGLDPICTYRDEETNQRIDLPMERDKFGSAAEFREVPPSWAPPSGRTGRRATSCTDCTWAPRRSGSTSACSTSCVMRRTPVWHSAH